MADSGAVEGVRAGRGVAGLTLLRALIGLLVALWVGALMFFPVVAAVSFKNLPDTHTAGTVVRLCLLTLHAEGLASGVVLLVLLFAAWLTGAYGRSTQGPMVVVAGMMALTCYSQYSVMPRMEADRLALGGAVDAAPATDPRRHEFDTLHVLSERVEEGVLVGGILLFVLLARPAMSRAVEARRD